MARYVIGDVQGCFTEFEQLLSKMQFDPVTDQLFFVGDLVNRGPSSLAMLRWCYQNRRIAQTVLGNHDLFLLACWLGFAKPKAGDTLDEVLIATDAELLLEWLITQPLIIDCSSHVITHAGIYPGWALEKAKKLAEKARLKYSGTDRKNWFGNMFGNKPAYWDAGHSEIEKFRFTINAFTRMRFCDGKVLDFKYKGELDRAPVGLSPWFESPRNRFEKPLIFGHWSALGLKVAEQYIALDSGCIWGGELTGLCLDDGRLFQVPALRAYQGIGE
ncbi:symmetrical bis(5'-nucleosyl)-tetraphosphatase [Chitinibacter sp. S2-10]|uniref:symmetrical bis(5'-nucleosyl)-tetraphosphatase n=1 Tax=Chitinibacter sp. S2-10 TaxID=3373597 RepID=UPI0039777EA8